ncbi:NAD(P)H-dependent oxidoreductase [Nocardia sp. JMUB6875]|uniref:NADPH-dependent FMN reductase n=1 Tax=Nocardia sp. JMUB6875 TaxID=3158170 RepID=UPI0032E64C11
MIRVGIIIASTRPGRLGEQVGHWVRDLAVEYAGEAAEFVLLDLHDYRLPLLDEPVPALRAPGRQPHTQRWAESVSACDAFIVVTPEYNTAPPPSLINAIDFLFHEWVGKPIGYVGYGIYGAVMAIKQLRSQAGAIGMADIAPQLGLTLREDFVNFSEFRPQQARTAALHGLVDGLLAWARALAPLRAPADSAASTR